MRPPDIISSYFKKDIMANMPKVYEALSYFKKDIMANMPKVYEALSY